MKWKRYFKEGSHVSRRTRFLKIYIQRLALRAVRLLIIANPVDFEVFRNGLIEDFLGQGHILGLNFQLHASHAFEINQSMRTMLSSASSASIPAETRLSRANRASGKSRNCRTVTISRNSNSSQPGSSPSSTVSPRRASSCFNAVRAGSVSW